MLKIIFLLLILFPFYSLAGQITIDNLCNFIEEKNEIRIKDIYIPECNKKIKDKIAFIIGKEELTLSNKEHDIYNNLLADIYVGRVLLQQILLEEGLAVLYPFSNDKEKIYKLFLIEEKAIKNKKGRWEKNKIENANFPTFYPNIKKGDFIIVQGEVDNIYKSDIFIYINFSSNWKTDFTIALPVNYFSSLDKKQLENLLVGKKIRARGFLEYYNGPMIKIDNINSLLF